MTRVAKFESYLPAIDNNPRDIAIVNRLTKAIVALRVTKMEYLLGATLIKPLKVAGAMVSYALTQYGRTLNL